MARFLMISITLINYLISKSLKNALRQSVKGLVTKDKNYE